MIFPHPVVYLQQTMGYVAVSIAPKKIRFTYDDLLLWEDDHLRHEIIEGEHFMSPSPTPYHQHISRNLLYEIWDYVKKNDLGVVFDAPIDVVFHQSDVCVPDIVFVRNENQHIVREKNIQGAPDLIIEILSEGTESRDRHLKYKRYACYGVKEYWIVDPPKKRIEVHDLQKQQLLGMFAHTQTLNTPTFPDIHLDLSAIF